MYNQHCTTVPMDQSTPIRPLPVVTDIDVARSICREMDIEPSRANCRRIARSRALLADGHVNFDGIDADGVKRFSVQSQNSRCSLEHPESYRVSFNGTPATYCTCEDWKRHDLKLAAQGVPFSTHQCKHGLSARAYWQIHEQDYAAWADGLNAEISDPDPETDLELDDVEWQQWREDRMMGGY